MLPKCPEAPPSRPSDSRKEPIEAEPAGPARPGLAYRGRAGQRTREPGPWGERSRAAEYWRVCGPVTAVRALGRPAVGGVGPSPLRSEAERARPAGPDCRQVARGSWALLEASLGPLQPSRQTQRPLSPRSLSTECMALSKGYNVCWRAHHHFCFEDIDLILIHLDLYLI